MEKITMINQDGEILKPRFYNVINVAPKKPARQTPKEVPTFKLIVDKTGKEKLIKDGKTDIYKKIQVAGEGMGVYEILERYSQEDVDKTLASLQGSSVSDFTKMPQDFIELQQFALDTDKIFESLPLELRREFGHNKKQFLTQAYTPDGIAKINGLLKPKKQEKTEEENKKDAKSE